MGPYQGVPIHGPHQGIPIKGSYQGVPIRGPHSGGPYQGSPSMIPIRGSPSAVPIRGSLTGVPSWRCPPHREGPPGGGDVDGVLLLADVLQPGGVGSRRRGLLQGDAQRQVFGQVVHRGVGCRLHVPMGGGEGYIALPGPDTRIYTAARTLFPLHIQPCPDPIPPADTALSESSSTSLPPRLPSRTQSQHIHSFQDPPHTPSRTHSLHTPFPGPNAIYTPSKISYTPPPGPNAPTYTPSRTQSLYTSLPGPSTPTSFQNHPHRPSRTQCPHIHPFQDAISL